MIAAEEPQCLNSSDLVAAATDLIEADYEPSQSVAIVPNGAGSASDRLSRLAIAAFLEGTHESVRNSLARTSNWHKVKGTWSSAIRMCEIVSRHTFGLPERKRRPFVVNGEAVRLFDAKVLQTLVNFHSGDTAISSFASAARQYEAKLLKSYRDDLPTRL